MSGAQFRPMLATAPEPESHPLRFPFYASPKLDGIRCVITPQGARTRALKEIPNRKLAALLSSPDLVGLDGELIAGDPCARDVMQRTSSAVMSEESDDWRNVAFHAFDCVDCWNAPATPFNVRLQDARRVVRNWAGGPPDYARDDSRWPRGGPVRFLDQTRLDSWASVEAFMTPLMLAGFEGVMLRAPEGLYKFGRSTAREQGLLKLKRFVDSEARVVGVYEREHNTNAQERSELGLAKRSTHKAGKVAAGDLGGVVVQLGPPWKADTLRIGNGWTLAQRRELWGADQGASLLGRWAKFKYQPEGSKDAPRLPVWLGWRSPLDMS